MVFRRKSKSSRKRPPAHFGLHVGIGRGKNAHIHAARGRRADAFEFAGFERAQKLGLQIHRHVGDFVEEERAAVGELEAAHAIRLSRR